MYPNGCPANFSQLFPELCSSLASIFSLTMKQLQVSIVHAWKLANVLAIFKGEGFKVLESRVIDPLP